jgi:hypothetical protein
VQDNISLIPPLVFHLASTHLGRDTQRQIHWSVEGPRGSETPTVGAPGRGLLRVDKYFPVEFQMDNLRQPLHLGTVLRFGSHDFISRDGSYDMVLLPSQHDDNDDRRLARWGRTRRRLPHVVEEEHPGLPRHPPRWRRRRRGKHGQEGGGTSLTVGLERVDDGLRGTCRVLSSHLRQRRVSLPSNVPTPSGLMRPAPSPRTCWVLASYLR